MFRALPFTEETKKYQKAQTYLELGNHNAAYELFQAIAASPSVWAEESKFESAYVLVHHRNPQKNYGAAEMQFEEFIAAYPKSKHTDEANTWLAMLKMFHETKAGDLSRQIVSLAARAEETRKELSKLEREEATLRKERGALLWERETLTNRVESLLNEKEALIQKNVELWKDAETLHRDKEALAKKIDVLNKEKKSLIESKAALQKILRDLTMVDVKMEKQRKKIKKGEN